ncbi:uncharacterized protein NEMAJ01_1873 [Nematocida major]|uniref:uncharacterized protein n=1 Tax=Nematocida major TaxID=1912982 RepID=UPI00200880D0|nr:uncharacterized protein NEMAJ01_1873 [Nematocida major]KAH9386977.1 hypothetical protein NEMAJ01_1873 [Nematocida major]
MRCTKNSPFVSINGITRCLNVLECVKNNPLLLREVLANIRESRDLVPPIMRVLTAEETSRKHGVKKILPMLLAVWAAIPEISDPQKVLLYLEASSGQENSLVRTLLLKTLLALVRTGRVDSGSALEAVEPFLFKGSVEEDYLCLCILNGILAAFPGSSSRVRDLLEALPSPAPLCHTPELMQLSLRAGFSFVAPLEAFSPENTALYTRTLGTFLMLSGEFEKSRLFQVLPEMTCELKEKVAKFIQKEVFSADYRIKHDRKAPFSHGSILHRVKEILGSPGDPKDVVRLLRALLKVPE